MSSPRKSHRKRVSTLRVSVDSLPEYNIIPWQKPEGTPLDRPPDYPDSAEEADEDTECEDSRAHPPRARRFPAPSYRRRQSVEGSDQHLDSLLARSVHALEMSNTLLQSSISTQSSLSAVLASDSSADRSLETQAVTLSSRIRGNGGFYQHWADDLDEISRGVEGLFGEDLHRKGSLMSVSSSLPTSSETHRQHRKRPSLELRKAASSSHEPQLHFSPQSRDHLVSPPPRALTQFWSTGDPDSLILPSTLGLRASPSCADWRPLEIPPSHSFRASLPVTGRPVDPSTPAITKLSSLMTRSTSPTSSVSSSRASSSRFVTRTRGRRGSSTSTSERTVAYSPPSKRSSPDRTGWKRPRGKTSRSRSTTPKRLTTPPPLLPPNHWCPPILEIPSSPSPPSSDESCRAKRTVQSLRKILDDQPPAADPKKPVPPARRPPAFLPVTPPPGPSSSTSTATASISRLYTKAIHSSSTRPPPPPAQSSMKQPSVPPTPSPSPTRRNIPDLLGGVARALGSSSAPGSGRNTPKRISFAELPESYSSSRSPGSSRFRRRRRTGKKVAGPEEKESGGWWTGWLLGASGAASDGGGPGMNTRYEVLEDQIGRGWGGRLRNGFDDWSI